MAERGRIIALDLASDRLTAIEAELSAGHVTVTGFAHERRPDSVDAADARAVGTWVRGILFNAGLSAKRVVIALERNEFVLKRISFEAIGDPVRDLPRMVRLQMARQLTFASAEAAIDFVLIGNESAPAKGGATVLAAAIPG